MAKSFFISVGDLLKEAQGNLNVVGFCGRETGLRFSEHQLEKLLQAKCLIQLVEFHASRHGWDRKDPLQILEETGDDLQRRLDRLKEVLCQK